LIIIISHRPPPHTHTRPHAHATISVHILCVFERAINKRKEAKAVLSLLLAS